MGLGELISKYRKEMNMTIDDLAEKSGVPKGTINKIIGGVTKAPTLENVRAIAYALGKTLDDFDDTPRPVKTAPPELSDEAKKIARDYEGLDRHGRRITRMVIDEEQKRMAEERPMIQAAARGGGVLQIEEVRPDELPDSELIP